MNIQREKRRCLPMAGLAYIGGDSSAATTNKSEVRDMRVVGGDASQNISANDSNVSVIATDHGAVLAGLSTADKAFALSTQLVGDNTKQVLNAGLSMFDGALQSVQSSSAQALNSVASARQDVAAAWQNSQTPENSMLKIAGFVVVGIAAVSLLAKRI